MKVWRTPADESIKYSDRLKFEDNLELRGYLKKNGHILSAEAQSSAKKVETQAHEKEVKKILRAFKKRVSDREAYSRDI